MLGLPGYATLKKPSVSESACQLNGTVRLPAPWMAWTKLSEPADQPLLVRFWVWQNEHVGPSLRWPAWNVGETPSVLWQLLHLVGLTMRPVPVGLALLVAPRRPVKPTATCHTFGGGIARPPRMAPPSGLAVPR